MFLKALTLKGFKSFAETTMLELQPGVTVVVGPNGSGKSNVVDAIGWVLGAQAPSAVRSQRMEDVIFAGTSDRPPLGRAEVSITIDNSAGLLPIEFSEVTITRTLWRAGDSEYAINGVPCRLLDIHELLSDTGVGRQQHVIVGQGQIDAVLNARPEDRRLIVEEAAGILKHRKRKERAERRLASTEANLMRLTDLLREVRRQLRPLERQAEAARRQGDLLAELRALQVHVAGRELATLKRRLGESTAALAEARNEETLLKQRLTELDTAVHASEAELASLGGSEVGDALRRAESLREKARGQLNVLAERRRGVARERSASIDQGVIASLEADAASLRADIERLDAEAGHLAPEDAALAEAEHELARERERAEREPEGGAPAPPARAAEVRGELSALRGSLDRTARDHARIGKRVADLRAKVERFEREAAGAAAQVAAAEQEMPALATALEAADAVLRDTESAATVAGERREAAETERSAWHARVSALTEALDAARSAAGAERLAGVEGVIGTLLDILDVDRGWEAAVEAACGEALDAVVADSPASARRALEVLVEGDIAASVLALGAPPTGGTPPPVGEPVRAHVRPGRPEVGGLLDRLLDGLLGGAVAVDGGWAAAVDAVLAHPDGIVVTRQGGRFGRHGWRVGTSTTGATGAALDEARTRAAGADAAATEARADHRAARDALEAAQARRAGAARRLDEVERELATAAGVRDRAVREREDAAAELASLIEQQRDVGEQLDRDQAAADELASALPALEAAEEEVRARARAMAEERERLDARAAELTRARTDIEVRRGTLDDRRAFLRQRLADVEQRLAGSVEQRRRAEARRVELDATERALERLNGVVTAQLDTLETQLRTMHERRRRESDEQRTLSARLDELRRERAGRERALEELRERVRRLDHDEAEVRVRLEQAIATCRQQLDVEPETAVSAPAPDLPAGTTPTVRVHELERELRVMGPVNPLALEEHEALRERHEFLSEQLDDVRSTRRELGKVIRAIDREIVQVFSAAFADVSENFERLFSTLFPGGAGRLMLSDPDDLLQSGVEVEAKPSGKNVKKLSLLSGGERSLTALAFLFAVFRSRPSPFYVMDEVEAALDDVNLHRFLDLVGEFRREAQLLIVSHQKRTMEAADCLYGVTMQTGGSSRVVSEKVTADA